MTIIKYITFTFIIFMPPQNLISTLVVKLTFLKLVKTGYLKDKHSSCQSSCLCTAAHGTFIRENMVYYTQINVQLKMVTFRTLCGLSKKSLAVIRIWAPSEVGA